MRNGGFRKKSEVFSKMTNGIEAVLSDVRLCPRIRDFFKLFSDKWRFFSLIWDILKDFEAF
jgi:hypothetical protein